MHPCWEEESREETLANHCLKTSHCCYSFLTCRCSFLSGLSNKMNFFVQLWLKNCKPQVSVFDHLNKNEFYLNKQWLVWAVMYATLLKHNWGNKWPGSVIRTGWGSHRQPQVTGRPLYPWALKRKKTTSRKVGGLIPGLEWSHRKSLNKMLTPHSNIIICQLSLPKRINKVV